MSQHAAGQHTGQHAGQPTMVTARHVSTERRPKLRLQRRFVSTFALLALVSSVAVAAISYSRTRSVLVAQRESSAMRQAFLNARAVRAGLRADRTDIAQVLGALATGRTSFPVVASGGRWYAISVDVGADDIPLDLQAAAARGEVSRQRVVSRGRSLFVVGVPIDELDVVYYEAFPLAELQRTLSTLAVVLATSAAIAAVAAAALGIVASRRLVRPLRRLSSAADRIAHGDLAARLDGSGDRSLLPLTESFNDMAAALQSRMDRDERFASNVSHELRSPLAAMRASLGLVTSRLDAMPDRARSGVTLLEGQVDRFERLVLDLLEISQLDASVTELRDEWIDLVELIGALMVTAAGGGAPVRTDRPSATVHSDKRLVERIVSNIVNNAERHGGGLRLVTVEHRGGPGHPGHPGEGGSAGDSVVVHFDDAGPGIAPADRDRIFERFARGPTAGPGTGAGLGLALVAQCAALLGGSVAAGDAPGGGARFTLTLPVTRSGS